MSSDPATTRRKQLRRFELPGHARFLTFSCYARLPLFLDEDIKTLFVDRLIAVRTERPFDLYAWVIMPEHVHLLVKPMLPGHPVPELLRSLKRPIGQRVISSWKRNDDPRLMQLRQADGSHRFWLAGGGYDRNIISEDEFAEKLLYIHRNPVKRGLVDRPEQYKWSSANWYGAERSGYIKLDPLPI